VFWETNLDRVNLKSIADCPFRPSKYVFYSDASATGCCVRINVNGEQVCHKECLPRLARYLQAVFIVSNFFGRLNKLLLLLKVCT